jgi:hypothetical protein
VSASFRTISIRKCRDLRPNQALDRRGIDLRNSSTTSLLPIAPSGPISVGLNRYSLLSPFSDLSPFRISRFAWHPERRRSDAEDATRRGETYGIWEASSRMAVFELTPRWRACVCYSMSTTPWSVKVGPVCSHHDWRVG